eukprot:TRINITY_DN12077_c0_g2_i1.p1 TRINITY_DN12077_c0_g2~~TRINITY_DN12077_c0_g2_i1.p1  ORF type:complete len:625 (-),score=130.46 TRINITY_DN12077_c0_g2_i1:62-1888(-)
MVPTEPPLGDDHVAAPPPEPAASLPTAAAAAADEPEVALDFSRGRELHARVPPERWCLKLQDLYTFVADVREEWRNGNIPARATSSAGEEGHGDPAVGPSLYQVNRHFVRPVTARAGGMSYALMKYPEGLQCEVFVTHAWAEGLFEFSRKVAQGFPYDRTNLYVCLLANPQNLDISDLIRSPERSPFALALSAATHILVVPNSQCSVYERLWCVFEAYLGCRLEKVFVMPTKLNTGDIVWRFALTIGVPCIVGALLGIIGVMVFLEDSMISRQEASFMNTFIRSLFLTVLLARSMDSFFNAFFSVFCACRVYHVVILLLESVAMVFWLQLAEAEMALDYLVRSGFVLGILCSSLLMVAEAEYFDLQKRELKQLRRQLTFESVRRARCSDAGDEERIRAAIADKEDEVDATINILRLAGGYTSALHKQYREGVSIKMAGFVSRFKIVGSTLTWVIVLFAILERGHKCSGNLNGDTTIASSIAAFVNCAVIILIPTIACSRRTAKPDVVLFAMRTLSSMGAIALLMTFVGLGMPEVVPKRRRGETFVKVNPFGCTKNTAFLSNVVFLWSPACALLALVMIRLGPTVIRPFVARSKRMLPGWRTFQGPRAK